MRQRALFNEATFSGESVRFDRATFSGRVTRFDRATFSRGPDIAVGMGAASAR